MLPILPTKRTSCLTGIAIVLYHERSSLDLPLSSTFETFHIMIAKFPLVGCIAAVSAVVNAQVDSQQAPTIFDRVDLPFTFTDCAAPTEMEQCWNAQNYTNEYLDPQCSGLQQRIDCALTNCWNRVRYTRPPKHHFLTLLALLTPACRSIHATINNCFSPTISPALIHTKTQPPRTCLFTLHPTMHLGHAVATSAILPTISWTP